MMVESTCKNRTAFCALDPDKSGHSEGNLLMKRKLCLPISMPGPRDINAASQNSKTDERARTRHLTETGSS